MMTKLAAVTYDGGVVLTLRDEDAAEFHALPPLPVPELEDFVPPSVTVVDAVTGRVWDLCRFLDGLGCWCGCACYAEDITERWGAFLAEDTEQAAEDEPLVAFTYGGGEIPLTLAPEDIAEFDALPRLPQEMPDGFEPSSVIVTDIVTGRTY